MSQPADPSRPTPASSREEALLAEELSSARAASVRSAERVLEVEQLLAGAHAHERELEDALGEQRTRNEELAGRLARADRVLVAMQRSLSWRVTAPLRALRRRR